MNQRRGLAVGALAVATLMVATPTAAASAPHGTVAVSPIGQTSGQQQLLTPVAGSTDRLVYLQMQTLGNGKPASDVAAIYQYGDPPILIGHETGATHFSLAGSMLTAVDQRSPGHVQVKWWNLANRHHGSATTPGQYAGAAPDGWIATIGNSIYDESRAGSSRRIARVASLGHTIQEATTGPNGVVVYGNGAAYVTFAGVVSRLKIGPYSTAHHDDAYCAATSTTATACRFVNNEGARRNVVATERISLDGQPPHPIRSMCLAGDGAGVPIALNAHQTDCAYHLGGILVTSDSTDKTHRRGPVGTVSGLVGALGAVVVGSSITSSSALARVPEGSGIVTLVHGDPSALAAGAFALSSGRVTYVDDPDPDHETLSVPLAGDRRRVVPGTPVAISHHGYWSEAAASGSTTIWGNGWSPVAFAGLSPTLKLNLGSFVPGSLSLSGNRVLYEESAGPPGGRELVLYDLLTRRRSRPAGTPTPIPSVGYVHSDLAGSFMAYARHGTIWRVNVTTGRKTKVTAARHVTSLFVYGPYVGWNRRSAPGSFRNVDAMGPITSLASHAKLSSLSNNGAVFFLHTHIILGRALPSAYYLRSFQSSTVTPILNAPKATSVAQVSDSIIAWVDRDRVLEVAPVNAPTTVPYSLGDPDAPSTYSPSDDGDWNAQFAYSTALTGCGVTISRGAKTVRVVACSADRLPLGVAAVAWDGKDAHGNPVAAGHYRWTVTVGNHAGLAKTQGGVVNIPRTG